MSLAIASFRTQLGMTQQDLANLTGLSKNAISNYELGKNGVGPRNITKLAQALQVTPYDLLNYQPGAYQVQGNQVPQSSAVKEPREALERPSAAAVGIYEEEGIVELPYVPIPARATFAEMSGPQSDYGPMDTIAVPLMPGETAEWMRANCVVFEVNGDSMEPTLHHGQRVVTERVDAAKWEQQSDRVYVVSYAGLLVIKRIRTNHLRGGNFLELWSDNEKKGGMKTAYRNELQGIWRVKRLDRAPEIY